MPWVDRNEPWHRTSVAYCDVTGQLLPRRYWSFEHEGVTYRVRDPKTEELFRAHVLAKRGQPDAGASGDDARAVALRGPPNAPR